MDLRSLYNWFNPEEEERKRELYLLSLRGTSPQYMDGAQPLVDRLRNKQHSINTSPNLNEQAFRPPTIQDYYSGMRDGENRMKNPKYPGMI